MNKKIKILVIVFGLFLATCALIVAVGFWSATAVVSSEKSLAKARQSEANSSLVGLYVAQRSFQAEFGEFTSSIKELKYLYTENKPRYKIGFANEFFPSSETIQSSARAATNFDPKVISTDLLDVPYASKEVAEINFAEMAKKYQCIVAKDTFKACAIGIVDADGRLDVWSINQDKVLVHETGHVDDTK